jgi:TonB family protein
MKISLSFPPATGSAPAGRAWSGGARFVLATLAAVCAPIAFPRHCLAQEPGHRTVTPVRRVFSEPSYPTRAMVLEASGDVTVQFVVDVNGQPRAIQIIEATAPQLFARTAMAAIRRWRYEPPRSDGKPVEVPVQVVVRFTYWGAALPHFAGS